MSMWTHVTAVVRACFAALRRIRSMWRSLSRHVPCWPWFVHWLSARWTIQLGSHWYPRPAARPAAVRLECRRPFGFLSEAVRTHNPIASWTPLVDLRLPERVTFQLSVLAYRCLHGIAPAYLTESLLRTSNINVVCVLLTQPCWWYCPPDVQHTVTVPSQWLWHVRGTTCHRLSGMHCRWRRSVSSWRLYFSSRRLTMIRRSWLFSTAQNNCCLPATNDCRRFCRFC